MGPIVSLESDVPDHPESQLIVLSPDTAHDGSLTRLFEALREFTDELLHIHEVKVGRVARCLAETLGCGREEASVIDHACAFHDIGKFAIPHAILAKPDKLGPDEISEVKRHTLHGAEILRGAGCGPTAPAVLVALGHHERFDGSGYPNGVAGMDIPAIARLAAVADVYDALRAVRPYKPALPHEEVMRIILKGDGRTQPEHFDPAMLEALEAASNSVSAAWDQPVQTLRPSSAVL